MVDEERPWRWPASAAAARGSCRAASCRRSCNPARRGSSISSGTNSPRRLREGPQLGDRAHGWRRDPRWTTRNRRADLRSADQAGLADRRRRPRRPRQQSRVRIGRGTDTLRAARPDGGRRPCGRRRGVRENRGTVRVAAPRVLLNHGPGRPDRHRDGSVTGLARDGSPVPVPGVRRGAGRHCAGASRPGCRDARRRPLAARGRVQFAGTTAFAGSSEVLLRVRWTGRGRWGSRIKPCRM